MTTTRWRTVHVTPLLDDASPLAKITDREGSRWLLPAGAWVTQVGPDGATRTVLGFRQGAELLTPDELPGYIGLHGDRRMKLRDDGSLAEKVMP